MPDDFKRHNRKLVIGGVDLVKLRVKKTLPAMGIVRDELEKILIETDFFANAPFEWIGVIVRFGLKDDAEPSYQRINKRYKDLPIALEIDAHALLDADQERTNMIFRRAVAQSLIHVGGKYNLPVAALKTYLAQTYQAQSAQSGRAQ